MEFEDKTLLAVDRESSLCRVCLSSDENNQCIFRISQDGQKNTDTFNFLVRLQLCGGVQVSKFDGLPTSICINCISKVNAAYELRLQCQTSDTKLRKLYGKTTGKDGNYPLNLLKDQYSQTEHTLLFAESAKDPYNLLSYSENVTLKKNDGNKSIEEIDQEKGKNIHDQSSFEAHINNDKTKENSTRKSKEVEKETSIKREAYRTRRMSMFKRVTSMESLKNHKEMQRQYIKKNANVKYESTERDLQRGPTNLQNTEVKISNSASELTYDCPKCDRSYCSKKSLDKHISVHNDNEFKCVTCEKSFLFFDKLLEHEKSHQAKEKPKQVSCRICQKNFRKMDTMVRHLNVHKRANPREVFSILKEIRDKRKSENNLELKEQEMQESNNGQYGTKENLALSETSDNASRLQNDISKFESEVCGAHLTTSDVENDDKSDTIKNVTVYRCKQCSKCYANEKSLQRHFTVHSEKKFVCNVCNMKFFRQDRLKSHRNRYGHDENKGCVELQKPLDDKSAIKLINTWIREELDSDNEGKGFPCRTCGKSYDTKKSLLKHQINAHNNQHKSCTNCESECICTEKCKNREKGEQIKSFACKECNKSFEKEIKLQKHIRIHERAKKQQDSDFKRFLCHICSKTFRQNTGLMFHMRTHTGYKPHVCKYCGRGFTSNSNCINHERTHTGDRPFVCHFCSAAFAKSCTLKAHITTHTGEANYHCKTCGKSFRRLKYLKEHRFTHTGEKPYACKICGTAYSHSGSLFVHEKKCKAQYSNYQTTQNTQNFCTNQTSISNSMAVITPLISTLPQSHSNNVNGSLGTQKSYIDNVHKVNVQTTATAVGTSGLHVHSNADVSDITVRSFALIGQMFHS